MGAERDWGQVPLTDSVTHAHRRNTYYAFPLDPTNRFAPYELRPIPTIRTAE